MKRTWLILGCALALGLGLTACDDGGTDPEDSGIGGDDGSMTMEDSGPGPSTPVVMAFDGTDEVEADLSCRGTATAPTGSGDSTFNAALANFGGEGLVGGLEIHYFPNNAPSADVACDAPCVSVTTDAAGMAELMGSADAWFGYRVVAGMGTTTTGTDADFVNVIQMNEPTPEDGGMAGLIAVAESLVGGFLGIAGISQDPMNGAVTGTAVDCQGRPLVNAQIRLFDDSGQIPFNTDTKAFYFNDAGSLPDARATESSQSGLYGVGNVPLPTNNTVQIGVYGTVSEGGSQELIGCESIVVGEDTISILNVSPLRSDGPSCGE